MSGLNKGLGYVPTLFYINSNGNVIPLGKDIELGDIKAIKTGIKDNDVFYLSAWDKDGAAYNKLLGVYGGINEPYLEIGGLTKLRFRDNTIYIHSHTDGKLGLAADSAILLASDVVEVYEYIKHSEDSDTYIRFTVNTIAMFAGNSNIIHFNETGLGFFGATVQAQAAHLADPTDLASCITAISTLIDVLKAYGLMAADP